MSAGTTSPRTTRRTILIGAGATLLGAAAVGALLASGAAAATARSAAAPAQPTAVSGMEAIWAQTDTETRHTLCTSYLANPAATWQILAPVLTAHGADRASTDAVLALRCADTVTLADLNR